MLWRTPARLMTGPSHPKRHMKRNQKPTTLTAGIFLAVAIFVGTKSFGQGFVNLDFEMANVSSSLPNNEINATNAFPGWDVLSLWTYHNDESIGGSSISIIDTNAHFTPLSIQGNYYALLTGNKVQGLGITVLLGQTGQIPIGTQMLTFWGDIGYMQITFDGHLLAFNTLSNGPNYHVYSADVSAYAGQVGELLFRVPSTIPGGGGGYLDNLQFSPAAVPEPGTLALVGVIVGALGFTWRRKANQA